jgi:hypothetical protein
VPGSPLGKFKFINALEKQKYCRTHHRAEHHPPLTYCQHQIDLVFPVRYPRLCLKESNSVDEMDCELFRVESCDSKLLLEDAKLGDGKRKRGG